MDGPVYPDTLNGGGRLIHRFRGERIATLPVVDRE